MLKKKVLDEAAAESSGQGKRHSKQEEGAPADQLPTSGTFVLKATDSQTGHLIHFVVGSCRWKEIADKVTIIRRSEEPGEFEGLAPSVQVCVKLGITIERRELKRLKQYLEQGVPALQGANSDMLEDLRDEIAKPLKMAVLAGLIDVMLQSPTRKRPRRDVDSQHGHQAGHSSKGDEVSDAQYIQLTPELARASDVKAAIEHTEGMNPLVRFVDRANSSISASEIVALADKIGITVHSAGTETLFKSRYLNDFITAEGVLQGYEVANPPPIEAGKEVEQTVPALKLWWAGMKASGVSRWEPVPVTKTSCPLLYQTRWPGTETGEKPPFIRGSPDVLFIEKAADAPLMIDNDENYKTYKKSGRRLFKAPLTFERLLAAATRGRLDVETKPTDAPEHEGQVISDNITANVASSAGPVATLRTDFGGKNDLAIPEGPHVTLYENLSMRVTTAFLRRWLLADISELPTWCVQGHQLLRSKLTPEKPVN